MWITYSLRNRHWPRPSARNHLRKRAESAWRLLITKQAIFQEQQRQRNWTNIAAPLHSLSSLLLVTGWHSWSRSVGLDMNRLLQAVSQRKIRSGISTFFSLGFLWRIKSLFYGIQNSLTCPPISYIEPYPIVANPHHLVTICLSQLFLVDGWALYWIGSLFTISVRLVV